MSHLIFADNSSFLAWDRETLTFSTPPGAGHRVVVEGLSSQSVRPLRGLTGEARSRPGVTVAGGPTVQSDIGQQLHPSRARHLHHDGRITETAYTDAVQYLGAWSAWER